jgi:hypothetical protein
MKDIEDLFSPTIIKQLPLNYYFLKKKDKEKIEVNPDYSISTFYNSRIYESELFYKPISKIVKRDNDKKTSI